MLTEEMSKKRCREEQLEADIHELRVALQTSRADEAKRAREVEEARHESLEVQKAHAKTFMELMSSQKAHADLEHLKRQLEQSTASNDEAWRCSDRRWMAALSEKDQALSEKNERIRELEHTVATLREAPLYNKRRRRLW